jgi:hypothetical protein
MDGIRYEFEATLFRRQSEGVDLGDTVRVGIEPVP